VLLLHLTVNRTGSVHNGVVWLRRFSDFVCISTLTICIVTVYSFNGALLQNVPFGIDEVYLNVMKK